MFTATAPTTETYPVHLDPTVSLADQIRAGNYGYASEQYTSQNIQLRISGKREVVFLDPSDFMSSEVMIARIKIDGYAPATLDDALAVGAKYPDHQRKTPIVFLGTVLRGPDGIDRVPVLDEMHGERKLYLSWLGDGWRNNCRFAAVRSV